MKTLQTFAITLILFFSLTAGAQVSVNINIGSPPAWGPVGYSEVQYYYLPDVEAYYDVQSSMFIYYGGGVWIHRKYLPSRYSNYDLYSGYKVVLTDYRGNEPYIYFKNHKVKYAKGYNNGFQKTIGDKPGKGNNKNEGSSGNSGHKEKSQGDNDQKHNKDIDQGYKHDSNKNSDNQKSGKGHGGGHGKGK